MPYTPGKSMRALRHFFEEFGSEIWSCYGFRNSFNRSRGWTAEGHLAIDQGPIVIMTENFRSGLIWNIFMSCGEINAGLDSLGFAIDASARTVLRSSSEH